MNRNFEDNKILILEKSKKGMQQVVYGRTLLVLLLALLQVISIVLIFNYLGQYVKFAYSTYLLIAIIIALIVINRSKTPEINTSWVMIILAVPTVGAFLYLYVEFQFWGKMLNRRINRISEATAKYVQQDEETLRELENTSKSMATLAKYLAANGNFNVSYADEIKYFSSGEEKFEDMLEELEKAEKFIFLEYFIIKEGYMWGRILKILEQKAKQGVEVRVMYDGMCSFTKLPFSYTKKIEKLGIQCKMFDPIYPMLSTHYNNRDHRKIFVIDGKVAYTGGINLSDEYINLTHVYGHWKDTAVKITGEGVKSFTLMFLQLWNVASNAEYKNRILDENYTKYLNAPVEKKCTDRGYVIPYTDSPFDDELVGKMVYMDIINRAKDYVYFMTPYLVIDHDLVTAIRFAAKRGVDVRIVLPQIPDKKYAFALAQNHYKELLEAGVKLYEYVPGFNHSKLCVSDDLKAVVGSINLDYRSLYLNFECGVLIYKNDEIFKIKEDVFRTIELCEEKTLKNYKKKRWLLRFFGKILKPLAPLI